MGAYDSRHTGRIRISPSLSWAQIRNNRDLRDLRFITVESTEDRPTGRFTIILGFAIGPLSDAPYGGHEIHEELQSTIDAFPGHEFTGTITARPEDPDGTPWRYIIRDRKVIRQVPQTTWVDEGEQQ